MFSCGFCEISKNTFFTERLWTTASNIYKKYEEKPVRLSSGGIQELISTKITDQKYIYKSLII